MRPDESVLKFRRELKVLRLGEGKSAQRSKPSYAQTCLPLGGEGFEGGKGEERTKRSKPSYAQTCLSLGGEGSEGGRGRARCTRFAMGPVVGTVVGTVVNNVWDVGTVVNGWNKVISFNTDPTAPTIFTTVPTTDPTTVPTPDRKATCQGCIDLRRDRHAALITHYGLEGSFWSPERFGEKSAQTQSCSTSPCET